MMKAKWNPVLAAKIKKTHFFKQQWNLALANKKEHPEFKEFYEEMFDQSFDELSKMMKIAKKFRRPGELLDDAGALAIAQDLGLA